MWISTSTAERQNRQTVDGCIWKDWKIWSRNTQVLTRLKMPVHIQTETVPKKSGNLSLNFFLVRLTKEPDIQLFLREAMRIDLKVSILSYHSRLILRLVCYSSSGLFLHNTESKNSGSSHSIYIWWCKAGCCQTSDAIMFVFSVIY